MVVGMQHQQQQPHASPATVLEDATTPCAVAPSATVASVNGGDTSDGSEGCSSDAPVSVPVTKGLAMSSMANAMYSNSRVKLRDVNPHLVCVLCQGYFVDATSIAECLHSFCRSCIILYLGTKSYCPICEVQINNSKPHLSLKPDKTLQDIVYKLVPGLFHAEMIRRNKFYQDHPNRDLHLHPEFRGIVVDRLVYGPGDEICVSLVYYDKSKEEEDWETVGSHRVNYKSSKEPAKNINLSPDDNNNAMKKHFYCPATVRVRDLKKIIRLKYNLENDNEVELFYRRESLPDDYSLMDIAYIYAWKRNTPMRLFYRMNILTTVTESATKVMSNLKVVEDSSQLSPSAVAMVDHDKPDGKVVEPMPSETAASAKIEKSSVNDAKPSEDIKPMNADDDELGTSKTPFTDMLLAVAKSKTNSATNGSTLKGAGKVRNAQEKKEVMKSKSKVSATNIKPVEEKNRTPIKSYLSISSILNDIEKPDSKKPTPVKSHRKVEESRKTPTPDTVSENVPVTTTRESSPVSSLKPITLVSDTTATTNVTNVVDASKTVTVPAVTQPTTLTSVVKTEPLHSPNAAVINAAKTLITLSNSIPTVPVVNDSKPEITEPSPSIVSVPSNIPIKAQTLVTCRASTPVTRASTPVSSRAVTMVAKASTSVPSRAPTPVTSRASTPVTSKAPTPVTQKASTPVNGASTSVNGVATPVTSKTPTPVAPKASTPVNGASTSVNGVATPVTSKASTPVTSRAPTPVTSRAPTPVTSRAPTPVMSRAPTPVTSRAPTPVTSRASTPVTSRAPTPITKASTPVTSRAPTTVTRASTPLSSRALSSVTKPSVQVSTSLPVRVSTPSVPARTSAPVSSGLLIKATTPLSTGPATKALTPVTSTLLTKASTLVSSSTNLLKVSAVSSSLTTKVSTSLSSSTSLRVSAAPSKPCSSLKTATSTVNVLKTTPVASPIMSKTSSSSSGKSATTTLPKSLSIPSSTSITMSSKSFSVPSSVPPLITITSTPSTTSSTYATANSQYILSHTKIPSSLEISLTSSKELSKSSPVSNLQKMVQQNFVNGNSSVSLNGKTKVDDSAKVALKRASGEDKKNEPEKKLCRQNSELTVSTNGSTTKKIFTPNILPEVSITLNPHPEQNKRISPETSYDVSCFKPKEANGVPPLTPISTTPVCKNIQNSPIKNLNKKIPPVRVVRNAPVSPKSRPKPDNQSDEPEAKKPRLENGVANGTAKAEVNGEESPSKSNDAKTPPVKKEARHQGIPKLIDINTTPYTKLMAQNAKARLQYLNSLYIKTPPPEPANSENALDLSSPSSKSPASDKSDPSPDKKKIIQSVPPLMIPVTMSSKNDTKSSATKTSPNSLAKIERKPSPIAKIEKSPIRKPEFRLDNGVSPKASKSSPQDKSPSTPTSKSYSPIFSKAMSPIGSLRYSPPELFNNAASINFLRQQRELQRFLMPLNGFTREAATAKMYEDWIMKACQYGALPSHPLMHPAINKPPSTPPESNFRFKK